MKRKVCAITIFVLIFQSALQVSAQAVEAERVLPTHILNKKAIAAAASGSDTDISSYAEAAVTEFSWLSEMQKDHSGLVNRLTRAEKRYQQGLHRKLNDEDVV